MYRWGEDRILTEHLGCSGVLTRSNTTVTCVGVLLQVKSYFAVRFSQGYDMHMIVYVCMLSEYITVMR